MTDGWSGEPDVPTDPAAHAEWHEVADGLWMGGGHRSPTGRQFDYVVTLGHPRWTEPADGVAEHERLLEDSIAVDHPWEEIRGMARDVADRVTDGDRVLVRCNEGLNRSGVVVARALMEMGWDVEDAIAHLRRVRSPYALSNTAFTTWLAGEAG